MISRMELTSRSRKLNTKPYTQGPIVYWMERDARLHDNWALIEAWQTAHVNHVPFAIVYWYRNDSTYLAPQTKRLDERLKQGLKKVSDDAQALGIPFHVVEGNNSHVLIEWFTSHTIGGIYTDFNPLREARSLKQEIAQLNRWPMIEVDAHNIVPYFVASDKQEWGAYTLRPKIHRLLATFLTSYPTLTPRAVQALSGLEERPSWWSAMTSLDDPRVALTQFIEQRLNRYEERNDPNANMTSQLSSFFHFGHLSTQTVALAVKAIGIPADSFLEEMIVRKELADNFCFYNPNYDSFKGFPDWAKKTLDAHRHDSREYVYDIDTFTNGLTHDDAWNAAQLQMVKTGYMHGYMRMYWAKKILEWTQTPEEALLIANTLNDQFEYDGRDPNGYTGTAWAIGGVHDRPWQERPIFGMIRFMNAQGLKRKFDIGQYIRTWTSVPIVK
jgi:deoxyribodipyrimidine photo-lyase